jgi:hypothetical protein
MKIVTINSQAHLCGSIKKDEKDGSVMLVAAMKVSSNGPLSSGVISSYLQRANVKELQQINLQGAQSYETRDLTAKEDIIVSTAKATFKLAKAMALPRLENQTFSELLSEG